MKKNVQILLVLFLILIGSTEVLRAGSSCMKAYTETPAQGLVYIKKNTNNPTYDYKQYSPGGAGIATNDNQTNKSCYVEGDTKGDSKCNFYLWAKAARGYSFKTWSGYRTALNNGTKYNQPGDANVLAWDGDADLVYQSAGGKASTFYQVKANWNSLTPYSVTYKEAEGGTYTVTYNYSKTKLRDDNSGEYTFEDLEEILTVGEGSGDLLPNGHETPANTKSYETDYIELSTDDINWIGWYENDSCIASTIDERENFRYVPSKNATVTAVFKSCTVNIPEEAEIDEGQINVKLPRTDLESISPTIIIPLTDAVGPWQASDFTITFTHKNGDDVITKGAVTYDNSTKQLSIPYTYAPSRYGGTDVEVEVNPHYGNVLTFHIIASVTEVVDYEARIKIDNEIAYTGSLSDMLVQANTMSNPTLELTQNVAISTPLSFTNSMLFDINGKTLTSAGVSAFSVDAAGVDVKVQDGSFSKTGVITIVGSSNAIASVVTFTAAAKLTLEGGTMSASNTSGPAYGVNVQNGSVFYMKGGKLTITAPTDARGVNVASTSDYATVTGGIISVDANTKAYGIWSAGQSNVSTSSISVNATTGAEAYGVYMNGGVSTFSTNIVLADAKTTKAYGAFVNAGRLNNNGGSFCATAVTSEAYGLHIAQNGDANIQQNTMIAAEVTTGNLARGINNLGTAHVNNVQVTATAATTDAIAINTQTSATSTVIENGSYIATAATGTAYGLHHQYGALDVDGGIFKGIVTNGNQAYGARATVNGVIRNAVIWGETQGSGNTAYGFVGGVANKSITLEGCNITAQSATSVAYGIYSRANVTATNCKLMAYTLGASNAQGFFAESGTNSLINDTANVNAKTTNAYGVNIKAGTTSVEGGEYQVTAQQTTASTFQNSVLYGIYSDVSATINNAIFNVSAPNNSYSQNAYGAFVKGTLNSTGCTYEVGVRTSAFGIYGSGANSNLVLQNNVIRATTTGAAKARGIYAEKNFSISGDVVIARSFSDDAYAMQFMTNADGTIENYAKFVARGNDGLDLKAVGPITNAAAVGKVKIKESYYLTNKNLERDLADNYFIYRLDDLQAEYGDGYRYVVAIDNPCTSVCKIIGGAHYATLEDAMQYAANNPLTSYTIVMTTSYTLSAGNYTLPSNASLLIPYSDEQTSLSKDNYARRAIVGVPEEFIRLTIAEGVDWNINGIMEVGAEMYTHEQPDVSYVSGPYGRIHLDENSIIHMNSGSKLYAWGYITGKGNIEVTSNAEVHEMFQVHDMKAMSNLAQKYTNQGEPNVYKYFPINQYFIQNIEVPTTYYYNSRLICAMQINYGGTFFGDNSICLIGKDDGFIKLTNADETAWVRKSYDPINDVQVWDIGGSAKLGSLTIDLNVTGFGSISLHSSDYILPVTSNLKIHVLKGAQLEMTQNTMLLPGMQLEIDLSGSLTIPNEKKLYIFDKDQWPIAITQIKYSPSWTNGTPKRSSMDAEINVHGKINVEGQLLTTKKGVNETTKTDGANIHSNNEDAGTIYFAVNAPLDAEVDSITLMTGSTTIKGVQLTSAKLKNADETYIATSETLADEAWGYQNNTWVNSYVNGCFEVKDDVVYVKPSEYVELKKKQKDAYNKYIGVEEENHTYLTAADDILILQDEECQWWEVETTSNPNIFECSKSGFEGFYRYNETSKTWEVVTVNVAFYAAEAGEDTLHTITTSFNDIPNQLAIPTIPTKMETDGKVYSFYGWKSGLTNIIYQQKDALEPATEDMYYRPVFNETKKKYTITLVDANNGASVPVETAYGELPSYTPTKAATPQYTYTFLGWSPTFAAVTGPATYTATWEANVNLYTITWMNEGTVLKTDKNQAYGNATAAPAANPTKDMDGKFVYTFDGWISSQTGDTTKLSGTTPTVAGNTTYSACYTTTPRYLITFINYDGEVLQQEPVTQGIVPAYADVPRRDPDRDGYFKFDGWKNSNGDKYAVGATLPAVTQKETYTSQWEYVSTVYTVTFVNYDGEGTSTGGLRFGEGEIPSCPEIVAKAPTAEKEYTLDYWVATSDGQHYTDPLPAVSKDETYTAHFAESDRQYTITWIDGNGDELKAEQVAYDSIPVYSGVTPTKASTAEKEYTFNNTWSPAIVAVSGDATYTAQFDESAVRYAITWINGDGSILKTDTVAVGETPVYSGVTPSKATTATQIFTFNNTWSPAVVAVSGDATYRAQFDITVRTYEIIFKDHDNTELKRAQYEYGVTPTCPQPSREGYVFTGWNPAISAVTVAQTYTAQYEELVAIVKHNNVSTPYGSLSAAVNAVQSGDTVVMQKDYNQGSEITFNKNMTLDLNGKTLSSTGDKIFKFSGNPVNIIDSSNSSTGKISTIGGISGDLYAVDVVNGGVLNLRSGTIYARNNLNDSKDKARVGAVRMDGGTFNMYGGNLRGICDKSYAYVIYQGASTVNIYGGDLYAEATTASKREWIIYNNNVSANLNIYGGEFRSAHNNTGDNGSYSSTKSGTINVSGGKFKGHNGTNTFKSSVSNVTGGYFVKTGNVSAKSGYQAIPLTDKHPEYANDYRYVVEVPRSITWDANGGTISTPTSDYVNGVVASGTSLAGAATPADPTRAGHTFIGWDSTLPETMPTEDVTITALWELIPEVTTAVEYTGNVEAENLTITTTGSVNVTSGSTLSLTNLYIQANASASGELFGAGTIEVDNAYMDYTFNGNAFNRAKQNWYAFAVPFEVDATTLQYKKANGSFAACGLGTAIDIIYYDGETRATQGTKVNAWKYVEDLGDKTLKPGTLYLATFSKDEYAGTVRFAKKAASVLISSNTVATAPHASSITTDANWNGIANPALCYSTLSADGVSVGQIYVWSDNDESNYKPVQLTEALSVGKPIFIQTAETVAVAAKADRPSAAPKRMLANADTKSALVDVRITAEGNYKYSDRLFVATDENAKNEYTIGADLLKAGVATKRAQMWVSNYNEKLCLNTVAPVDNVAEYALGISVPNADAYVIEQASENEGTLYLTHNGEAIWNLSDMPYTITMEAGTNNSYGLRFVRTIPGVVTNLGEASANAKQGETQKLIKDNHLLIINNGRVYDAQGAQLR